MNLQRLLKSIAVVSLLNISFCSLALSVAVPFNRQDINFDSQYAHLVTKDTFLIPFREELKKEVERRKKQREHLKKVDANCKDPECHMKVSIQDLSSGFALIESPLTREVSLLFYAGGTGDLHTYLLQKIREKRLSIAYSDQSPNEWLIIARPNGFLQPETSYYRIKIKIEFKRETDFDQEESQLKSIAPDAKIIKAFISDIVLVSINSKTRQRSEVQDKLALELSQIVESYINSKVKND